jgi:hypothetical protein
MALEEKKKAGGGWHTDVAMYSTVSSFALAKVL